MTKGLDREVMAMRAAREFQNGDIVNLGIGIPTLASNYIPEGRTVIFHSEGGVLGYGPVVEDSEGDINLTNAGGQFVGGMPGMSFFHSADAFAMIRGGHIDVTVLGALQVSGKGDLANWMLPERGVGNVGGAMDLATGAKRVVVIMEHTTREGHPKILNECSYPLTAAACIDLIITDLAVIEVTRAGLVLREHAPGVTASEIQALTQPQLLVSEDLREVQL